MKRIAIIGGGISGLAAAFVLQKQKRDGAPLEYVVFESGSRFGGVIHTGSENDCVLEAGPDSFLSEKSSASDLCRELGLGDQLIGSNDAERKTYILLKNRLTPLPEGLLFMVPTRVLPAFFSPLFSWRTKLRMIGEWFSRANRSSVDTSVAEFVSRHYGREMVERVADPLLAGVYGGSADDLSVHSVLPRFAEIEASQGSLGRGLVNSRPSRQGAASRPLFTSLKHGMQQMTDALLAQIPDSSRRLNTSIESVAPESGKWLVVSAGRTEEFDGVILAVPAHAAAEMLVHVNTELAASLNAIPYSSSVTVVLAYDQKTRSTLPAGFGFLVPRTEGRRILAATFVHNKFRHRAPENLALIRCFLGGTRDKGVLECTDDEIRILVCHELHEILGIGAEPVFVRIYRWKHAMAQYGVGHRTRVGRIRELVAGMPGLAVAGNAYAGIGVPDCVRSGTEAAGNVLAGLGVGRSASHSPP